MPAYLSAISSSVKERLQIIMNQDQSFTEEDIDKVHGPCPFLHFILVICNGNY
jgi:hypothetical protein